MLAIRGAAELKTLFKRYRRFLSRAAKTAIVVLKKIGRLGQWGDLDAPFAVFECVSSEHWEARLRRVAENHPASSVPLYYFKWSDTLHAGDADECRVPCVRVSVEEFDARLNLASMLAPDPVYEFGREGVNEGGLGDRCGQQDGPAYQFEPEVIPGLDGGKGRLPVPGQAAFDGLGPFKDSPQELGSDNDEVV